MRGIYLSLLLELAGLYEDRGQLAKAIETSSRVVTEEPTREGAHTGLMRIYALSSQQHEALLQYERLRGALHKNLDREQSTHSRRLYQEIRAGSFPATLSAVRSPEEPAQSQRHNLPASLTSFVGRESALVEVKRLFAMTRLLVLTGAGGSGKTRLALEVARDLVSTYADGVWLVELAPLPDAALVPQAVATVLEVREQPGRSIEETLSDHLRSKDLLLVLDNCEHLVEAAAHLADVLLKRCPKLRVLATSREPLGVAGEVVWAVPPLSLPGGDEEPTVESLMRAEAVRFFLDRTRSRLPGFELIGENVGAVIRVCRRLEGIPLAIELAAARMGALAVEQVAQRLEDSLKVLTGGSRTADPRHQTLRATLDWSYELLSEPERMLLGRLSVFAGAGRLRRPKWCASGEG